MFSYVSYSQYYKLFRGDVDTLKYWFSIQSQGSILPFELIKKLELVDMITLTEIGLQLLSFENLSRLSQTAARYLFENIAVQVQTRPFPI